MAYYDLQRNPETGKPGRSHCQNTRCSKAALKLMEHSRVAKEMHAGDARGGVVFAFPLTTDIAKALEIDCKKTGLLIAMRPDADVLAKFMPGANGKPPILTGFSIGGQRVTDEEIAA